MEKTLGRIKKVAEKKEESRWIVGGDFNARTRERGALEEGEEAAGRRISKDKVIL